MTSMLHDTRRNDAYFRAIRAAVHEFREREHRSPIVCDIGTGTGLLAMMAAKSGARHVFAFEMFAAM
jgi:protein arginine N-methyltransferase 7